MGRHLTGRALVLAAVLCFAGCVLVACAPPDKAPRRAAALAGIATFPSDDLVTRARQGGVGESGEAVIEVVLERAVSTGDDFPVPPIRAYVIGVDLQSGAMRVISRETTSLAPRPVRLSPDGRFTARTLVEPLGDSGEVSLTGVRLIDLGSGEYRDIPVAGARSYGWDGSSLVVVGEDVRRYEVRDLDDVGDAEVPLAAGSSMVAYTYLGALDGSLFLVDYTTHAHGASRDILALRPGAARLEMLSRLGSSHPHDRSSEGATAVWDTPLSPFVGHGLSAQELPWATGLWVLHSEGEVVRDGTAYGIETGDPELRLLDPDDGRVVRAVPLPESPELEMGTMLPAFDGSISRAAQCTDGADGEAWLVEIDLATGERTDLVPTLALTTGLIDYRALGYVGDDVLYVDGVVPSDESTEMPWAAVFGYDRERGKAVRLVDIELPEYTWLESARFLGVR